MVMTAYQARWSRVAQFGDRAGRMHWPLRIALTFKSKIHARALGARWLKENGI